MAVNTADVKNKLAKRQTNGHSLSTGMRPIDRLKAILNADSVKEQFENVLRENAGAFIASIIDLFNSDPQLQQCDPKRLVGEALKAASLKLPINKQLGFAWIVPYKDGKTGEVIPVFQLGYKGYIQLALRTGAYRYINADVVYEGELVRRDKLTGAIELDPEKKQSDKIVGYFAYLETLNGFSKAWYMTVDEVRRHAERYSKSYRNPKSQWHEDFDGMALKTCIRQLISKYGIMSTEMQRAYIADSADMVELADRQLQAGDDAIDVEGVQVDESDDQQAPQPIASDGQQSVLNQDQ